LPGIQHGAALCSAGVLRGGAFGPERQRRQRDYLFGSGRQLRRRRAFANRSTRIRWHRKMQARASLTKLLPHIFDEIRPPCAGFHAFPARLWRFGEDWHRPCPAFVSSLGLLCGGRRSRHRGHQCLGPSGEPQTAHAKCPLRQRIKAGGRFEPAFRNGGRVNTSAKLNHRARRLPLVVKVSKWGCIWPRSSDLSSAHADQIAGSSAPAGPDNQFAAFLRDIPFTSPLAARVLSANI